MDFVAQVDPAFFYFKPLYGLKITVNSMGVNIFLICLQKTCVPSMPGKHSRDDEMVSMLGPIIEEQTEKLGMILMET